MPPSPLPQAASLNVAQAFAEALRCHEQGRLAEAERLYAMVLMARPEHFEALQMLAVLKHAKGEHAEALRLIAQAMTLRRPSPQILLNYGMILHALNRSEEAIATFDQALKQKSKFAEAHNNRGAVLSALRRAGSPYQLSPKALLQQTLVSSGTMTNRIDRLVSRGLVERRTDPNDGRGILVQMTAQGLARVDAAITRLVDAEADLLDGLSAVEQERLAGLLRKLSLGFDAGA